MDTHEVDQHATHQTPRQVMSITQLRAHPLRMLVVSGTPAAFAATGLLHLLAWPSGSNAGIYTGSAATPRCGSPSTSSSFC